MMESSIAVREAPDSWLDRILSVRIGIRAETLVFAGLLIAAFITRFYDLEGRVMSHDESLHTQYSWNLEQGLGFQHTPLMHGPLQFHLVAFSYFLFGDTDATARVPAALAGVAAIALLYAFKRWLGTTGALTAAALMLISPYMLYYSRYVRNEAFVVVEGLLTFLAIFRYFETRRPRWLFLLVVALALHFTTKETAFIYTAQVLLFLSGYLIWRLAREHWRSHGLRGLFLVGVLVGFAGTATALVMYFRDRAAGVAGETGALQPLDPVAEIQPGSGLSPLVAIGAALALVGAGTIALALVREFRSRLRTEFPSLDLVLVITTLILPLMAAIPANILGAFDQAIGWDPLA